jgi:hypothetical protein
MIGFWVNFENKATGFVNRSATGFKQKRRVKDNPNSVLNETNNVRNMLPLHIKKCCIASQNYQEWSFPWWI